MTHRLTLAQWTTLVALILSTLAFVATLVLTIYTSPLFRKGVNEQGPVIQSYYIDPPLNETRNQSDYLFSTYHPRRQLNPVEWNCAISHHVVYGYDKGEFGRLCAEGIAAFDLMIPMTVFQAITVAVLGFMYWRERRDAKAATWAGVQ